MQANPPLAELLYTSEQQLWWLDLHSDKEEFCISKNQKKPFQPCLAKKQIKLLDLRVSLYFSS